MKSTIAISGLILMMVLVGAVVAEDTTPPAPMQPPPPRQQGPGGPDQPARQWQMRFIGAMQPGAIFATEKNVYVLRGDTLYQFRASDLELVKKVTVPSQLPPLPGPQPAQP